MTLRDIPAYVGDPFCFNRDQEVHDGGGGGGGGL